MGVANSGSVGRGKAFGQSLPQRDKGDVTTAPSGAVRPTQALGALARATNG